MPGRGKTEEEEIIAGKMGWGVGYWDPNRKKRRQCWKEGREEVSLSNY